MNRSLGVLLALAGAIFLFAATASPSGAATPDAKIDAKLQLRVANDSTPARMHFEFQNLNVLGAGSSSEAFDRFIVAPSAESPVAKITRLRANVFVDGRFVNVLDGDQLAAQFQFQPDSVLRYTPAGEFRYRQLGQLKIAPFLPVSPVEGKPARIEILSFDAELAFAKPLPTTRGVNGPTTSTTITAPNASTAEPTDPLNDRVLDRLVITAPEWNALFFHRPLTSTATAAPDDWKEVREWDATMQDAATKGRLLEFELEEEGIAVISAAELAANDVDLAAIESSQFELFEDGERILAFPGKLPSPKNDLIFLSSAFSPTQRRRHAYILATGVPSKIVGDISMASAGPPATTPVIRTAMGKVAQSPAVLYHHQSSLTDGFSHWYWMDIEPNEFAALEFDAPAPATDDSTTATLRIEFLSLQFPEDYRARAYLNGEQIGESTWRGGTDQALRFGFAPKLLREKGNKIVIEFPAAGLGNPAASLLLRGFALEYPRTLRAVEGRIDPITLPIPGTYFFLPFEGFQGTPLALQMNDGLHANSTLPSLETGRPFGLDYRAPKATIIAVEPSKALKPKNIRRIEPPTLLAPSSPSAPEPETIAIAPAAFIPAATQWRDWHAARGEAIRLVALEDIYLAFNHGAPSPEAIRVFVEYAYRNARTTLPSTLVLIGESADLEGAAWQTAKGAGTDWLPVYAAKRPSAEPRSDNPYGHFPLAEPMPDMTVARIPAATPEAFAAYFAKVRRFVEQPATGPWRARNLFIADDETMFTDVSEKLKVNRFPEWLETEDVYQRDFPYEHLFRGIERFQAPKATAELLRSWNDGALTVNYFGHGGPNIWTGEMLFHQDDVKKLTNAERLPFLTISSCDTAWLDYPLAPARESLAELFVMKPDGGAIASFAPTGSASAFSHEILMNYLYTGLFEKNISRLGDLGLYARAAHFAYNRDSFLIDQYELIGDPLIALNPPAPKLDVFITPAHALIHSETTQTLTGRWPGIQNGTASAMLRLEGKEARPLKQDIAIRNGRFTYEWRTPPDLPPGKHAFGMYAAAPDGREAVGGAEFEIVPDEFQLIVDPESKTGQIRKPEENIVLSYAVENRMNTTVQGVKLLAIAPRRSEPVFDLNLDFAPRQRKSDRLLLRLGEGLHVIKFFLYGPGGRPGSAQPWEQDTLVFPVLFPNAPAAKVAVDGELFVVRPFAKPANQPLFMEVPAWNLGTRKTGPLVVQLQNKDGKPFGKTQEVPDGIAPATKTDFHFELGAFPPGNHELRLVVAERPPAGGSPVAVASAVHVMEVQTPADLLFEPGSVEFDKKEYTDGETVFIRARLRNAGGIASPATTIEAFKGSDTAPTNQITTAFGEGRFPAPALEPGESRSVELRWDTLHNVGPHLLRLYVNRDGTATEGNTGNNFIEGAVEVQPLGNFSFTGNTLNVAPAIARPGQKVVVTAEARSDRPRDLSAIPVAFEAGNDSAGFAPEGGMKFGPAAPGETFPLRYELEATPARHAFALDINAGRVVSELMLEDNRVTAEVEMLLNLSDIASPAPNRYDLIAAVGAGRAQGLRISPRGGLTVRDAADFKGASYDIMPANLEGDFTASEDFGANTDKKWAAGLTRSILASPEEDAAPIRVNLPYPPGAALAYDVYAVVETNATFRNSRATKIRFQLPGQTAFTDFDFSDQTTPYTVTRHKIGRAPRLGDRFTLQVDNMPGAWAVLHAVELVPVSGTFESPIIDMGENNSPQRTVTLHTKIKNPEGAGVEFSARTGALNAQGEPQWQPWTNVAIGATGDSQPIPAAGRLLQWRALAKATVQGAPEIEALEFTVE